MVRAREALAAGLVGLLALVLGLSACSADPAPGIPEARASSSGPSSSSAAMSPEETVRAWVQAQNFALKTGKTQKAREISTPSCHSCFGLLDPIDDVYRQGGYFHTPGWRIDGLKLANAKGQSAVVNAAVTIRGGRTVTAKGRAPVVYGTDRSIMRFRLRSEGEQWRVAFVGFLS